MKAGLAPMSQALWRPQARPQARLRLLCFAYAGGGANVFRGWEQVLSDDVELTAVQLPGREWRRSEPALTRIDAIVDHLLPAARAWLNDPRPGVLFGYSMGAALAYALAARLQSEGSPTPRALIVAACRAPQLLRRMTPVHRLDDDRFAEAIRHFGGLPEAVTAEPALLQMALPALRADFEALGTYQWPGNPPLPCPITVYGGSEDPHATRAELAQWRVHTQAGFQLRLFSGGHFFINDARAQLLRTLSADLAEQT